jgi:hypothetical protein
VTDFSKIPQYHFMKILSTILALLNAYDGQAGTAKLIGAFYKFSLRIRLKTSVIHFENLLNIFLIYCRLY